MNDEQRPGSESGADSEHPHMKAAFEEGVYTLESCNSSHRNDFTPAHTPGEFLTLNGGNWAGGPLYV